MPGSPPGLLTVDPEASPTSIRVLAYDKDQVYEHTNVSIGTLRELLEKKCMFWVDVVGLGDTTRIRELGELFNLHPLALEDAVHLHQRPKVDSYDEQLFCVMHRLALSDKLSVEQESFFLGKNYVISFHEYNTDFLEPVRQRLRKTTGRIRDAGSDYLAYAIIDAIVDNYFPVLDKFAIQLEGIEDKLTEHVVSDFYMHLQDIRRDLLTVRRAIWPLRELLSNMMSTEEVEFISEPTTVYLRDCYDHVNQLIDLLENCRELCSSLMETYHTSVATRTNEVMKVLTIISTIFIPLNFIAGIYGMNFNPNASPLNMPELNWFLGYPFALSVMLAVALGLTLYFRRKGWL